MARVLLFVAAIVAVFIGLILVGGSVLSCMGPLGVTHVQCIAAINSGPGPDYAPGPAPGAWIPVAVASVLLAVAFAPWRLLPFRTIAAIVLAGIAGALVGSVVYDLTRETSLTGPTSTGRVITVTFGPNTDARLMGAAIGAGVAIMGAAILLRARLR